MTPDQITADESWRERALCAQSDPEAWFPGPGESIAKPKRICRRCPVIEPCREAGRDEPHGIYGGMTAAERRRERRAVA